MINDDDEWKKYCDLVAHESDPHKLSQHLDLLIRALDARKKALRQPAGSAAGKPSGTAAQK